ncbi:hypothetical protein K438DRAFT_1882057 [Mycena galopus ATCC 62051]|nr:hypothetical protein K438DRAFT_1882057 [Mycena galopus ATCC 62051]
MMTVRVICILGLRSVSCSTAPPVPCRNNPLPWSLLERGRRFESWQDPLGLSQGRDLIRNLAPEFSHAVAYNQNHCENVAVFPSLTRLAVLDTIFYISSLSNRTFNPPLSAP